MEKIDVSAAVMEMLTSGGTAEAIGYLCIQHYPNRICGGCTSACNESVFTLSAPVTEVKDHAAVVPFTLVYTEGNAAGTVVLPQPLLYTCKTGVSDQVLIGRRSSRGPDYYSQAACDVRRNPVLVEALNRSLKKASESK